MLLSVMAGYALLFAALRLFGAGTAEFLLTAGFFTAVGVGQALLFGGNAPRAASFLVGVLYLGGVGLFGGWVAGPISYLLFSGCCGYAAGLLVAGVFLVYDAVAGRAATPRPVSDEDH